MWRLGSRAGFENLAFEGGEDGDPVLGVVHLVSGFGMIFLSHPHTRTPPHTHSLSLTLSRSRALSLSRSLALSIYISLDLGAVDRPPVRQAERGVRARNVLVERLVRHLSFSLSHTLSLSFKHTHSLSRSLSLCIYIYIYIYIALSIALSTWGRSTGLPSGRQSAGSEHEMSLCSDWYDTSIPVPYASGTEYLSTRICLGCGN